MKKLFSIVAVALMALSTFNSNAANNDNKAKEDSLAYYFGTMWGNGVGTELKNAPQAAFYNKARVLKGLKTALSNDTTKQDFMQGLQIGIQLNNIARTMLKDGIFLDLDKVFKAFETAFTADSIPGPGEAQGKAMNIISELKKEHLANSPEAKANKEAGEKYIADQMAKDAAFKKTESGLVYKVIKEGAGEPINPTDLVRVKYVGKHIDGTEFDNSGDKAREFTAEGVVKGFGEGMLMMKKGAHYILILPSELGYGSEGQPYAKIGPNETLVFDVELVEIVK